MPYDRTYDDEDEKQPGGEGAERRFKDFDCPDCSANNPWDDGFGRLSKRQWDSLWLQHRCHEVLGMIGRYKSGDTFDYESWVPFRGDLRTALNNGCN